MECRCASRSDESDIICITIDEAKDGDDIEKRSFFTYSQNISIKGLSFTTHRQLAAGTKLKLTVAFSSPSTSVRNLAGRVAWASQIPHSAIYVIGIDLSESDDAVLGQWQKTLLQRILSECSPCVTAL